LCSFTSPSARAASVPEVTMTSTLSATSSAARAGSRSSFPLGISGFDHEVAALDVPEVTQSLTEGLVQVGPSGQMGRQVPYSSDLACLPRLGGERRSEEAARDHRNEPSALHHWVFPQRVCESGARGCGAWGNRAGSMQEPSLEAGRESSRGCQAAHGPCPLSAWLPQRAEARPHRSTSATHPRPRRRYPTRYSAAASAGRHQDRRDA